MPSEITKLMGAGMFQLFNLEGSVFENRFPVSGETYIIPLEFPFLGDIKDLHWFYYDPDNSFQTLRIMQAEIVDVQNFDGFKADAEIFIHQTSDCRNIKSVFPEEEMPGSLYNLEILFPVGTLKSRNDGEFFDISSLDQDGGYRLVIHDDGIQARIIFFAEGWFNHWQPYAGNILVNADFMKKVRSET